MTTDYRHLIAQLEEVEDTIGKELARVEGAAQELSKGIEYEISTEHTEKLKSLLVSQSNLWEEEQTITQAINTLKSRCSHSS